MKHNLFPTLLLFIVLFGVHDLYAQAVYNGSSKHTFTTNYGVIEIGPFNTSWAHIYTNRPNFIFNKPVYTTANTFSSYNNDLILQTEGNSRIVVNDDTGFVQIGSSQPKEKLQIGNAFAFHDGGDDYFAFRSSWSDFGQSEWNYLENNQSAFAISGTEKIYFRVATGVGKVVGDPISWIISMTMDTNGNVGVGTTAPDAKLSVNGDIHAEEVKVDLSVPGPDYVFKDDYNLKSLEEVELFIAENGHLPNIPSAKEMENNGVELGIMNMKLLEKIEEITLYLIDLKRENKLQQDLINQLLNEER